MLPLRVWLLSKLMWDPSQDEDKLIDEFCNGYFGAAGPFMRQYVDAVNAPAKDPKFRANCFNQDLKYLTDNLLKQCNALFDSAESAVRDQPAELARVRRERLVLESLQLQREDLPKEIEQMKKQIADPTVAAKTVVDDYETRARDWASRAILAGMLSHNYSQPTEQVAAGIIKRGQNLIPATQPTH
jgi:hypothetical protein